MLTQILYKTYSDFYIHFSVSLESNVLFMSIPVIFCCWPQAYAILAFTCTNKNFTNQRRDLYRVAQKECYKTDS